MCHPSGKSCDKNFLSEFFTNYVVLLAQIKSSYLISDSALTVMTDCLFM